MSEHGQRLLIALAELSRAHLGSDPDAPAQRPLLPGQVRLAVEAFSLTATNITYAAFGETMKYWQFFAGDAALGCLPVWRFATVAESQAEGVMKRHFADYAFALAQMAEFLERVEIDRADRVA